MVLDRYRIIRRRGLSKIWELQQVLMGYVASTSYAISSLEDGLNYAIIREMKIGLSNWYHSMVRGTTPITTLRGTRFRTAALGPQRTTG